jgi:glycosyltransferase involved in cell wall biosynthesis
MRSANPYGSVIVTTFNRSRSLAETLEALARQNIPAASRWELVVVDNNSRDETPSVVRAFAKTAPMDVRYRFEARQGQAYARNAGIEEARGQVLAFTDDDVTPAQSWIAALDARMAAGDVDGVGGSVLPRWEAAPPAWLLHRPDLLALLALTGNEQAIRLSYPLVVGRRIVGANMAFRRAVFEEFGGFDPRLGHRGKMLFGMEEVAFVNGLLKAGRAIEYDPEIRVFHRIEKTRMSRWFFTKRIFCHAALLGMMMVGSVAEIGLEAPGSPSGIATLFGAERWRFRTFLHALALAAWRTVTGHPSALDGQLDMASEAGHIWGQIVTYGRRERGDRTRSQRA